MPDQKNEPQQKVTLEELLKVKRSERPDQAFWGQFDRELHQRMMQTLVKKDPWYVQVLRAFQGRIAQTATISGLAALLLLTFGRSLIVQTTGSTEMGSDAVAQSSVESVESANHSSPASLPTAPVATESFASLQSTSHDYGMVAISGPEQVAEKGFKRDFALESLQVAQTDRADYSGDVAASSLSFVSTGVASLVY